MCVCVCVCARARACSAHNRQVHLYSFLSNALFFIDLYELPILILSSILVLGLPGVLLPSTLPSITRERSFGL